ncbi:MAG: NFACT family protein [Clostridia bacterium]|nr:NFACT family protein [Clostridia bacterium]
MPIDGVMLRALKDELSDHGGARLDRITQPERDEVILFFYSKGKNRRLLLSANAASARVQWVGYPKENPAYAPNFCMLLRKHLASARLIEAVQPGLERVLVLRFDCKNDFYEAVEKRLIIEIMGRASNLILTDGEGRIYDALRQVDLGSSSPRRILPGVIYELPPSQNKISLLDEFTIPRPDGEVRADRFLTSSFEGFSPLLSREISFRTFGTCDADLSRYADFGIPALQESLSALKDDILQRRYRPTVLKTDVPKDFYCFPITQYGESYTTQGYETCSDAMDAFYSEKDTVDHIRRHSADISKLISTSLSRLSRKIEAQRAELADSAKGEEYRLYGDLIVSNLYRFKGHESSVVLTDYTQDPPRDVKIALDPSLSASRNAQIYYKRYKKAQTAKNVLKEQIDLACAELAYLQTVSDALTRAGTLSELVDLRRELAGQGYLRKAQSKRNTKDREMSKPLRYVTSDGFTVLCGRNNMQNDTLTLRTAERRDIWFHVKNSPGSHTILISEGKTPTNEAMTEAAIIAATNSSLREADNVAVDYTEVRNVKKPAGAKPGMVVYETYKTAYVTPDQTLCGRLIHKCD